MRVSSVLEKKSQVYVVFYEYIPRGQPRLELKAWGETHAVPLSHRPATGRLGERSLAAGLRMTFATCLGSMVGSEVVMREDLEQSG